jgi:hypothetical protein
MLAAPHAFSRPRKIAHPDQDANVTVVAPLLPDQMTWYGALDETPHPARFNCTGFKNEAQ